MRVPIKIPVFESDTDESDHGTDVSDFEGHHAGRGYNADRIDALRSGVAIYERADDDVRATVREGWSFLGNRGAVDDEDAEESEDSDEYDSTLDSSEQDDDDEVHGEEYQDEADKTEVNQDQAE